MKIVLVSCSKNAYRLAKMLEKELATPEREIEQVVKCSALIEESIEEPLKDYIEKIFSKVDAIVFFCATGIAVRCIANVVNHKSKDPAVLVVDELGRHCISLLSGHIGGANVLTLEVSNILHANPVITTATDIEHKFSVDEFATEHNLVIHNFDMAKKVAVDILYDCPVYLASVEQRRTFDFPYVRELEKKLINAANGAVLCGIEEGRRRIEIEYFMGFSHFTNCLCLVPKVLMVGIGCKKNTPKEAIEMAFKACFMEHDYYEEAVCTVASIDLKKNEPGLLEFCEEHDFPFEVFSAEELSEVEGEFTPSSFVKSVTGVDNVCERSAVAACHGSQSRMLVEKYAYFNGVTIAVALKLE